MMTGTPVQDDMTENLLSEDFPFDLSLLAAAVEATSMSFIITDHSKADTPIVFCNQAFCRLTGYSREDILGKNCRFLQGNDHDQAGLVPLRTAISEGKDCTTILRNYKRSGAAFRNELVISPVHDDDGQLHYFIGIQRDLTNAPMPHDIADQFRHDWRTPLTVVKTTLQLLQQRGLTVDPAFLEKSLATAVKAIERLESLGGKRM